MANLTPTPEENADVMQWDGVTPLAGGGPTAPLNRQAQALLNRVQWLKEQLQSNFTTLRNAFSGQNRIINPTFSVNQRSFSGGALSAATYGHDRWKAGSGGVTYTVADETATISSGTLVQIIEGVNVPEGGTYTLSWSGTAQARVDDGAYAASPITVTGKSAGVNTSVEFGVGTVTRVQYESGNAATGFERRLPFFDELLCLRYTFVLTHNNGAFHMGVAYTDGWLRVPIHLDVAMRVTPSVTFSVPGTFSSGFRTVSSISTLAIEKKGALVRMIPTVTYATGDGDYLQILPGGSITFSAEL